MNNKSLANIAIVCVVYDRVADIDSFPRLYQNEAQAIRDFKQSVNMPSDYMTFHAPNDFELVKVSEVTRSVEGLTMIASTKREVLVTGTAAVDQNQREVYIKLSAIAKNREENNNASQQVS